MIKLVRRRIIAAAIIAAVIVAVASFVLVHIKDVTYFHSPPYDQSISESSDVLVVYYSRSGNTEAMAREIARKYGADIIRIDAPDYSLDFNGWRNANRDAGDRVFANISPEVVDMSAYRLVFLGSPIWWFRPAPPLWTFVEKNDLSGKHVVLFNTFNSRFKAEEIGEFEQKVMEKGGLFIDHVYVRRGRVYNQKSGEKLIDEAQRLVDERMSGWGKHDIGRTN
jgi:flavodoxin